MSVLITPLPDGDALIMTTTWTLFLRYVQLITISSDTRYEEGSHILLFWGARKQKISADPVQLFEVREQLLKLGEYHEPLRGEKLFEFLIPLLRYVLGLVYESFCGKHVVPKINVIGAFQLSEKYICRTERYQMAISKETFVRIQEELLAKHLQTPELEELKRQNTLMRAHIEFSPDGRKFIETMESFKAKVKEAELKG